MDIKHPSNPVNTGLGGLSALSDFHGVFSIFGSLLKLFLFPLAYGYVFQNHILRRGGFRIRPPLSHKWPFAIHGRAGHARPLQCGCLLSTLSFLPESAPARGLFLCPYPLYSAEKLWYTEQVIE